jgi:hypothetical protein
MTRRSAHWTGRSCCALRPRDVDTPSAAPLLAGICALDACVAFAVAGMSDPSSRLAVCLFGFDLAFATVRCVEPLCWIVAPRKLAFCRMRISCYTTDVLLDGVGWLMRTPYLQPANIVLELICAEWSGRVCARHELAPAQHATIKTRT